MAKRWQCLDVGCGAVVSAGSDEQLVEAANADAPDDGAQIREEATR